MPRITISIPADLKDQLAEGRVRKGLNVSRICQEALRREVRRVLQLPLDLERMDLLLSRLRQQREQLQDQWFGMGANDARAWVEERASYQEMAGLGELGMQNRQSALKRRPPLALSESLQNLASQEGFNQESYTKGWATALGLMWEAIKDKL
jgi:hypothetical protein